MRRWRARVLLAAAALAAAAAHAEIRVRDDAGNEVALRAPARRIVSLAPHATELLFEAGAGRFIVGTVKHADYPEAAKAIPRVGDNALLDMERIVALRPDLLVVWLHGNSEKHLAPLAKLGIPMYYTRPGRLRDIPGALERLGTLAGTRAEAERGAAAFGARLERLERTYAHRDVVRVFFQVWSNPLLTINRDQVIDDAIRTCGGRNVFAEAKLLVPAVDVESVVQAAPEAVVRTAAAGEADGLDTWRRLPGLPATAAGNLLVLRTDALGRPSARILEGVELLCEALQGARNRRKHG